VPVRALHTALNYLITSSEAILTKRWLVRVYDELQSRFRYGWDGDVVIVLWVHDELVVAAKKEIAADVAELLVRHAKEPADFYGFRVPLEAGYTIGNSWAGDVPSTPSIESPSITKSIEVEIVDGDSEDFDEGYDDDDDDDTEPGIAADPAAITSLNAEISEFNAEGATADDIGTVIRQMRATIATMRSTPQVPTPAGKTFKRGRICCPFHADDTPSLEIYAGEHDPHFHCFGCGRHGPLDELNIDLATVALSAGTLDDIASLTRAFELWDRAKPIAGTPAEDYLTAVRSIDLGALPATINEVLRFHPRCPFGSGNRVPCLLALYRDAETDERAGIHRIALTPEVLAGGSVERLTLGRWARPRAIKLWPAGKDLFVGEGLETVLAAATRLSWHDAPMQPAWAAGAGGLSKLPVLSGVARLIILVDNDGNGTGQAVAAQCAGRWSSAGRTVVKLLPKRVDSDFNDIAKEMVS
jgi:hypothetical protein